MSLFPPGGYKLEAGANLSISTPGYPNEIFFDAECNWRINSATNYYINITFHNANITNDVCPSAIWEFNDLDYNETYA